MQQLIKKLTDEKSRKFADQFGEVFKTVPHLPKAWVDFLVKIAPPLALIGAILSLISGPILGLVSAISLITLNPFLVFSVALAAIIAIANAILLWHARKPLEKRSIDGWMLLFWSDMLSVFQIVAGIFLHQGGLGGVIGLLIGFYILFEMRPRYK